MIPDIAYLILNYNPDGEERATSVLNQTIDTFYERRSRHLRCDVFLLDQGSTLDHRRWLIEKQQQYGFSTILLNRNIGISRAINIFVRTCKSPVIGLITSDVLITSGMDEDLYEKVQIPEIYQATPFTDKSDVDYQTWQPSEPYGADRVDLKKLKAKKASLVGTVINRKSKNYLGCVGVEFNVMFWRRSIFEKIGYFDERWKAAYENNDFSLRCFLAGGCTGISMNSFVWHYHKITDKNQSRERSHDGYLENWPLEAKNLWDRKWGGQDSYINIYKPLKNSRISNYPNFYEKFKHNIYLPFEQAIDYF
ncbi:MAG: glycosyltransferase [Pseudomonadota bacterium]